MLSCFLIILLGPEIEGTAINAEWVLLKSAIQLLGMVSFVLTIIGLGLMYLFVRVAKEPTKEFNRKKSLEQKAKNRRETIRILHWFHAGAFLVLVFTGLIPFVSTTGIMESNRLILFPHLVAAIIFVAVPIIYLLRRNQTSMKWIREAFTWGPKDVEWLVAARKHNIFADAETLPTSGQINPIQKIWRGIIIIFGVVLLVTGLVMWALTGNVTSWLFQWATYAHDVAFIVVAEIVLFHITFLRFIT